MNKVLCPIDFSTASLNSIEIATSICEKTSGNLIILNVFTEEDFNKVVDSKHLGKTYKELLSIAEKKLQAIANEILLEGKVKGLAGCTTKLVQGDLEDEILRIAGEENCDLIVMGTTGVGKSTGMIIGSNTSGIIKKSTIPVLSIPEDYSYSTFEKIVFATDTKDEDRLKLQDVVSFATLFNSRIYVLHLQHGISKLNDRESAVFLEELKTFVSYDKISFELRKAKSDFSHELLQYVHEKHVGLLMLYSPQRSYFSGLFHKSVTQKLSVLSDVPIYVLK